MDERQSMMGRHKADSGFTIIEILIVIVVLAFILLLIFFVVPRARQESRNFQRKQAVDLTVSALEEYRSNNGHIPYTASSWNSFKNSHLNTLADTYDFSWRTQDESHTYIPPLDTVAVQLGHSCNKYGDGDNASDPIAGLHHDTAKVKYVVWVLLEANSQQLYCIDNRGK